MSDLIPFPLSFSSLEIHMFQTRSQCRSPLLVNIVEQSLCVTFRAQRNKVTYLLTCHGFAYSLSAVHSCFCHYFRTVCFCCVRTQQQALGRVQTLVFQPALARIKSWLDNLAVSFSVVRGAIALTPSCFVSGGQVVCWHAFPSRDHICLSAWGFRDIVHHTDSFRFTMFVLALP